MSALMLFLIHPALASKPVPLTVVVEDTSGAPVTSATIRVVDEGDVHRVHAETARWTTNGLVTADGTTRSFQKASEIRFDVEAPGFEPVEIVYVFRKKKNEVVVRMTPVAAG